MARATSKRRLVEIVLGRSLEEFVRSRRPERSWRLIVSDLYEATGVEVTYETLRAWYPDETETAPLARSA